MAGVAAPIARGVEPVAIVLEPPEPRRVAQQRGRRIDRQALAHPVLIEVPGGLHFENPRPLAGGSEQVMKRRHAAVVEVWIVRPYPRERRRRIALALDQPALGGDGTRLECFDEPPRDDIEPRPVGPDIHVPARPCDTALAVVHTVTARATDVRRVEDRLSLGCERTVDRVRVSGRPQVLDDRPELLLDFRQHQRRERLERSILFQFHRGGHERERPMKAAVHVPSSCRHLGRRVPQRRHLHVAPSDFRLGWHRTAVRPHIQLDMRRSERRRSGAGQRINLVVMVACQDVVRQAGEPIVEGTPLHHEPAARIREQLQRVAEHPFVEDLGPRAEVRTAVDLGGMAEHAVDGPFERHVRRTGGREAGRHPVRLDQRVFGPQHEPNLLPHDRIDVAHDRLRHEVAFEKRLRNPRGALVGLVDELAQGARAVFRRAEVIRIPGIDQVADIRLKRRLEGGPRRRARLGCRRDMSQQHGNKNARDE